MLQRRTKPLGCRLAFFENTDGDHRSLHQSFIHLADAQSDRLIAKKAEFTGSLALRRRRAISNIWLTLSRTLVRPEKSVYRSKSSSWSCSCISMNSIIWSATASVRTPVGCQVASRNFG